MMPTNESRYQEITRRAFLRRLTSVGLAATVPGVILAACGSDAEAFGVAAAASATSSTTQAPSTATSTVATTASAAPSTTPTSSTLPSTSPPGGVLVKGADLVVEFTYAASSGVGGPVHNPYVAVWIEDEAGDLVATVALWFLQTQKGTQWLKELRRWATIDGGAETIDAISSATRSPGSYRVVWDGTSIDGSRVTEGTYYIGIEAAREHGPYSLIREPITIGSEAFTTTLDADGELSDAAVSLVV